MKPETIKFITSCNRKPILQGKGEDIASIEPGSVLVCYPGHPVIDLVVFSTDSNIFFIQISELAYDAHKTHLDDLFEKKVSGSESIFQYYFQKCFGRRSRVTKSLPDNVHYLYITTDKTVYQRQSKFSRDPVVLICGDSLSAFSGWEDIKQHF